MKYNKDKGLDNINLTQQKKLVKNSSWESLQTIKKVTKSLVKSNSQINFNQKTFSNIQSNQLEIFRKNASLTEFKLFNLNFNIDVKKQESKKKYNAYEYNESNEDYSSEEIDYKKKWESLRKTYEKKKLELERMVKLNQNKNKRIKELESNLKDLIKYNSKLESINLPKGDNMKINEFFKAFEIKIANKDNEISELIKENNLLKKRSMMSDVELERKYTAKLEKETNKFENVIKQILLDKHTKINELNKEITDMKEVLNDYKSNYINKQEHELAMDLLKDELKEVLNKNNELERSKKLEINDKNFIFTLQSNFFDKSIQESKHIQNNALNGYKSLGLDISSFSKSFRKPRNEEFEDEEASINEEVVNISSIKLIKPNFKEH